MSVNATESAMNLFDVWLMGKHGKKGWSILGEFHATRIHAKLNKGIEWKKTILYTNIKKRF